jgi:hypothetical protein
MRQVTAAEIGPYGDRRTGGERLHGGLAGAAPAPGAPPAAAVENSPTGTNIQEAAVDEPDVAKTDGGFVYTFSFGPWTPHGFDNRLSVVDTAGAVARLRGSVLLPKDLSGSVELLVLTRHRLLVIGHGGYPYPHPGPAPEPDVDAAMSDGAGYGFESTALAVVDAGDVDHPTVGWTETITGSYVSARLHDGVVRLVLGPAPHIMYRPRNYRDSEQVATARNLAMLRGAQSRDFLPIREVRDGAGHVQASGPLLRCDEVNRPETPSGSGILTVLTFDARRDTRTFTDARATGVIGDGELVYSSADRLYVATVAGGWTGQVSATGSQPARPLLPRTAIHVFDATERDRTPYLGSGTVPGFPLSSWAFSEHNGYLRVATTSEPPWAPGGERATSGITVLAERDDGLRTVGVLGGLGRGESIRAVRWFDDLAAVVTFRETDPLYLVDLSDPRSPQLRGQLKVPGYSAYLHPTGDSRLLGIGDGPDTDARGNLTGHQAQVFDISQPAEPKQTDSLELDPGWPTPIDPHAFTYLTERHLAVVVVTVDHEPLCPSLPYGCPGLYRVSRTPEAFALSVDPGGGLHLAGRFTADQGVVRVLPVAGRLFAVTDYAVYLLDPQGLTPINSTPIAPEGPAAHPCAAGHCPP